jgi:Lar family restriction alleviation protein
MKTTFHSKKKQQDISPCPFCGGKAELQDILENWGYIKFYVQCKACRSSGRYYRTEETAIRKWNQKIGLGEE